MVNDASESLGDSRGEALALARIARSAAAEAAKRAGDLGAGDVVLSETQGANADAKMRHVIGAAREALTTSAFAPGQAVSAASSLAAAVSLLFGQHLDNPSKHANDVHELVTDVFERAVNELCESDDQNGALKVPLAVLRGAVRLALAVPAPVFVESGVANSSRHERLIAALEKGLYAHAKATAACTSLACHMQYSVIFSEQLAAYVVRNGAVDAGCLACEWSTLHESEGSFRTNVVRFQINLLQQLVATRQAKYARDLCGRRLAAHELEEPHLHVATPFVQLAYDLIAIDKMVMRGQMEVAKIYVKNVATRPRAKRLTAFENVQQAQQAVIAARESLIAGEQCSDGSLPTPPPLLTMSRESYVRLLGDAACRCLVRRGLADVAYGWLVSDWELPPKELDVEARKLLKLLPRHGESRMPVKAEDAADAEASAVMRAMRGLLLCDIGEGSTTAVDAELLGILCLAIPTHMSEVDPIDVDHPENLSGIAQLRAIASASASTRQGHYHNLSLDIRIPDTSRDASGGAYMISNLSEGIWAIEHLQRAASSSSDGICVIGADAEWRPETNWQSGEGEHAALDEDAQPLGSDGIPPLAMPGGSHRVATLQLAVKDAAFVFDMPALAAAYAADGSGHNSTTFALGLKALFGGSEEGEGHACVLIGHGLGEDLRRVRRGYGATFDGALLSFAKCLDLSPLRLMLTAQGSSNSSKNGRVSLSRMVEEVIGKPLDKTQRLTDWEKRPLEDVQLAYAALDAVASVEIWERMEDAYGAPEGCRDESARKLVFSVGQGGARRSSSPPPPSPPPPPPSQQTLSIDSENIEDNDAEELSSMSSFAKAFDTWRARQNPTRSPFSPAIVDKSLLSDEKSLCRWIELHTGKPTDRDFPGSIRAVETKSIAMMRRVDKRRSTSPWIPAMVILPACSRVDMRAAQAALGGGALRLATPEECKNIFGFVPGSVPAGGFVCGTPPSGGSVVDSSLLQDAHIWLSGAGSSEKQAVFASFDELVSFASGEIAGISVGGVIQGNAPLPSPQLPPTPLMPTSSESVAPMRFAIDPALGKLGKWLRCLGLDAAMPSVDHFASAHLVSTHERSTVSRRWLRLVAARESRVVLTRDRRFLTDNHERACLLACMASGEMVHPLPAPPTVFFVTASKVRDQLAEVVRAFPRKIFSGEALGRSMLTRCNKCGASINSEKLPTSEVQELKKRQAQFRFNEVQGWEPPEGCVVVQNEEDGDEMDDSLLGEMEDTSDGGTVNDGNDDQLPVLPVWVRDVWRCSRCPRLFWVGPKSRRTVMHLEAVVKPLIEAALLSHQQHA